MRLLRYLSILVVSFLCLGLFSGIKDISAAKVRPFEVKRLSRDKEEDYLIIDTKYKCTLKEAEDVKIKFYVLFEKKKKIALAVGEKNLSVVEKGSHNLSVSITPENLKRYGNDKKYRVEIWYKGKLLAAKTKPKSSIAEKWWLLEKTVSIINTEIDIKRFIENLTERIK